jgi:hypothetical protein
MLRINATRAWAWSSSSSVVLRAMGLMFSRHRPYRFGVLHREAEVLFDRVVGTR